MLDSQQIFKAQCFNTMMKKLVNDIDTYSKIREILKDEYENDELSVNVHKIFMDFLGKYQEITVTTDQSLICDIFIKLCLGESFTFYNNNGELVMMDFFDTIEESMEEGTTKGKRYQINLGNHQFNMMLKLTKSIQKKDKTDQNKKIIEQDEVTKDREEVCQDEVIKDKEEVCHSEVTKKKEVVCHSEVTKEKEEVCHKEESEQHKNIEKNIPDRDINKNKVTSPSTQGDKVTPSKFQIVFSESQNNTQEGENDENDKKIEDTKKQEMADTLNDLPTQPATEVLSENRIIEKRQLIKIVSDFIQTPKTKMTVENSKFKFVDENGTIMFIEMIEEKE